MEVKQSSTAFSNQSRKPTLKLGQILKQDRRVSTLFLLTVRTISCLVLGMLSFDRATATGDSERDALMSKNTVRPGARQATFQSSEDLVYFLQG